MLRKLRALLRKRSKEKPTPERVQENPGQEVQRLVQKMQWDNFWNYTGDEQPEIDPAALLSTSH